MKSLLVAVSALLVAAMTAPAGASWPGGNGRIAFTACDNGCEGRVEVFDVAPRGGRVRQLTHSKLRDGSGDYTPDGNRIVYSCKGYLRGNHTEICVMDADGRHRTVLTDDDVNQFSPSWSPDARRIAFSQSYDDGDDQVMDAIYVMRADGSHFHRIVDNGFDPAWSPDGKRIAFVGVPRGFNQEVYLIRPDGTHQKRITHTSTSEDSPDWSPRGRRLAFMRYLDVEGRRQGWQVFTMKRAGADQKRLTTGGLGLNLSPAWSPNGYWIALSRRERIYKMKRDGSHLRKVAAGMKQGFEYLAPIWQPIAKT